MISAQQIPANATRGLSLTLKLIAKMRHSHRKNCHHHGLCEGKTLLFTHFEKLIREWPQKRKRLVTVKFDPAFLLSRGGAPLETNAH